MCLQQVLSSLQAKWASWETWRRALRMPGTDPAASALQDQEGWRDEREWPGQSGVKYSSSGRKQPGLLIRMYRKWVFLRP